MTSTEQKILACATELNPDSRQQQKMRQLMSQDVDVDNLISLAYKEGIAGLLYKNLMKSGVLENLGQEPKERLQTLYYQTVLSNLKLIQDLKEILPLFDKKKIRIVLLQGIALLQPIYDDVGLRPLTDIDLWVLPKDYAGLISILTSQGYERDLLYPHTFRKGSTIFDLHTQIPEADRIKARKMLLTKSQENIYHETQVAQFEGQEVLCLSQYDKVLFLGLHALKHSVSRLVWIADIKSLLVNWKSSDWEALIHRAAELGQEKTLVYIFFLLRLFDFKLPPEARQFIERKRLGFLEKKALRERISRDSLPIWSPLLLISPGNGLKARFFFILETLFPRPEILRQVFPDFQENKVWKLYWKRAWQLLGFIRVSLKRKKESNLQ
jgi:hypothetical protein